jgi:hypothetical protein
MSDLINRDDVVYLITHQRNGLLEAAEREKPHHAAVLRDMAAWWRDLSDAVKKLAARSSGPSERDSLWNLLGQCETIAASGGSATHCVEMIRAALKPQTSEPK